MSLPCGATPCAAHSPLITHHSPPPILWTARSRWRFRQVVAVHSPVFPLFRLWGRRSSGDPCRRPSTRRVRRVGIHGVSYVSPPGLCSARCSAGRRLFHQRLSVARLHEVLQPDDSSHVRVAGKAGIGIEVGDKELVHQDHQCL